MTQNKGISARTPGGTKNNRGYISSHLSYEKGGLSEIPSNG